MSSFGYFHHGATSRHRAPKDASVCEFKAFQLYSKKPDFSREVLSIYIFFTNIYRLPPGGTAPVRVTEGASVNVKLDIGIVN